MVPQGETKIEFTGRFADPQRCRPPVAGPVRGGRGGAASRRSSTAAVSSVDPIAQGKAAGREQPWRLPISNLKLAPKGSPGDSVTYSFQFAWAKDFDAVRDVLYKRRFDRRQHRARHGAPDRPAGADRAAHQAQNQRESLPSSLTKPKWNSSAKRRRHQGLQSALLQAWARTC